MLLKIEIRFLHNISRRTWPGMMKLDMKMDLSEGKVPFLFWLDWIVDGAYVTNKYRKMVSRL